MDSIDITDSTFSLEMPETLSNIPDVNTIISSGGSTLSNYSMFFYVGIAILVGLIGMFVYKFSQNKKSVQYDDNVYCEDEVCPVFPRRQSI